MSPVAVKLKHISRFRDRHGHLRHYLRLPGRKAVPLPGEPGSPEFMARYNTEVAEAAKAAPATPQIRKPADGTLDAVAVAYYRSAAFTGLRASSQATYRRIVEELRAKHGEKPVRLLDDVGIRKLMEEKGEHRAAANRRLRVLRALMARAIEDKVITRDPTFGVKRLKRTTKGFGTWSEEEIALYEAKWPSGTRQRLALYLLLYTGQRRSDVVRMGRQNIRSGLLELRQVKTGTHLEIPIHDALKAELAHVPDGQLLFLRTEAGEAFTANGFYMRFRDWCDAADVPRGRSPHGLRKACGRRLAEAGATAHQIMAILGLKTLALAEVYTRAAAQKKLAKDGMARIRKQNAASNPTRRRLPTLPKTGE
jgi:integrase